MTNILAIIPARGGSKRIPNKNIKKFLGKEIIAYSIESLLEVKNIKTVIVSTDSTEIESVALKYGASVPFIRSEKNSDDFATTYDVIEEVLNNYNENFDVVCCIYPTSVFVTANMLTKAIDLLLSTPTATSVVSVLEYSHPIQRSLTVQKGFLASNHPDFYNARSQDLDTNYHDAGQFYIFKPEAAKADKKLITQACIPFIINSNNAQDIDTIDDWKLAELKYQFKTQKV